jgi:hypothetical protein
MKLLLLALPFLNVLIANAYFFDYVQVIDLLNPGTSRKPLAVRWSKKSRGFFVENLFVVDCEELDDLLAVLEEGKFKLSSQQESFFLFVEINTFRYAK